MFKDLNVIINLEKEAKRTEEEVKRTREKLEKMKKLNKFLEENS
jgi:hypothetical protein